jgi:pimeloyl-ACP methyl ester carboxylesterase
VPQLAAVAYVAGLMVMSTVTVTMPRRISLTLMTAAMVEMDDGARLRAWTGGSVIPRRLPLVMVHGGPGVRDYLAPVAGMVEDLGLVHRYDQRGTGGSAWDGEHTIGRHVQDLVSLLDAWGHDQVVLVGHSFGTNMASYFLLAHPERVAGLIQVAGPFLDPWREADLAAQRARRSGEQQARLDELDAMASRTDAEEIEYLTLAWFTDHADRARAWDWALAGARTLRPVNYAMNAQLNAAKKTDPLESRVDELRRLLPPGAVIIGGAGDTRPAAALRRLGARLSCEVIIIADAGHQPWLEAPGQFAGALRGAVKRQAQATSKTPAKRNYARKAPACSEPASPTTPWNPGMPNCSGK